MCPACGSVVLDANFCMECGINMKKYDAQPANNGFAVGFGSSTIAIADVGSVKTEEKPEPSDKGLQMLVNYCKKTVATVGGDGYDEIVLWRDDTNDTYQVHTYTKYQYMPKEIHKGYKADTALCDSAYAKIEENRLEEYVNKNEFGGFAGGMYVCKYTKEDGSVVRVTTDNLPMGKANLIHEIGQILYSVVKPENQI